MQQSSTLHTVFQKSPSFLKEKVVPFLRQSFLIPFIFASLLYMLMRVFFIGSDFDLTESVELYVKTFFVTWSYINVWRLVCYAIVWIESKTAKVKYATIVNMDVLKKTAIIILIAGISYKVKAGSIRDDQPNKSSEAVSGNDIDPRFYFWMK
jgi:hypothetical protein